MIVNLTPHDVHVIGDDGAVATIPRSGQVARVAAVEMVAIRDLDGSGIPLKTVAYGPVEGLPEPAPGVWYLVSLLVRQAAPEWRGDLISPGTLVRDADGRIVGCSSFYGGRP